MQLLQMLLLQMLLQMLPWWTLLLLQMRASVTPLKMRPHRKSSEVRR
jgi:hypothetical protein